MEDEDTIIRQDLTVLVGKTIAGIVRYGSNYVLLDAKRRPFAMIAYDGLFDGEGYYFEDSFG